MTQPAFQSVRQVAAAALLLFSVSCNSNQSIALFSAGAGRIEVVLPLVAAIPYNSCVERRIYTELSVSTRAFPDRKAAGTSCASEAAVRDRLAKEFSVLTTYMKVLGTLAAGDHAAANASARQIGAQAASLAGSNDAVSAIAGALETALLQGRTNRALRQAIEAADPHVQALCAAFVTRVARIPALQLDNQELELRAIYSDNLAASPSNRLLLFRQFDAEQAAITRQRELTTQATSLFQAVATAHAHLFRNRDRLGGKEALAELLSDNGIIGAQLTAIAAILK